jgi:hypothetical protein
LPFLRETLVDTTKWISQSRVGKQHGWAGEQEYEAEEGSCKKNKGRSVRRHENVYDKHSPIAHASPPFKMLFRTLTLASLLALSSASPVATPISQGVTPVRRQAASLCSQYAYYAANGYEFNNNNWGKGAASSGNQCTTVQSTSGSGVSWSTSWTWQGGQDNVKSYANVASTWERSRACRRISSGTTRTEMSGRMSRMTSSLLRMPTTIRAVGITNS